MDQIGRRPIFGLSASTFANLRIGRQIAYVCVSVIGAAAVINPPAFASATSTYVDREATAAAMWLIIR